MAYHEKEYQKRLSLAHARNALITLIAINLILFVILAFVKAIYTLQFEKDSAQVFSRNVMSWFALSPELKIMITRPWTIVTHMFTDIDVWRVLGNMLWLWVFGYILHDLTGNRKIFPVFIYGGLLGALAFVLAYNLFPTLNVAPGPAMGASAGVMAIAAAVTTISPGYRVFPMLNGGIPIWIVTAFYLIIDLATISLNNPGGHITHLGGALAGYLFIVAFRRGVDLGGWMNHLYDWCINLFNPEKPKKGKSIKTELFYKSETRPFKKTPNVTSQRVDEILDKINQKGYNSLSEEEKELLRRASKEDI